MSTILDAVRERDRLATPVAWDETAWSDGDTRPPRRVIVLGVLALAGAAATVVALLPGRDVPKPPQVVQARPAAPQPQRPAPVAKAAVKDDPPWGRVGRWNAPAAARTPARSTSKAVPETAPPQPKVSPAAPPEQPAQTSDGSALRVQSINYSSVREKRTVTLTVDGSRTVTLRQGESAAGIEVQLILRDAVYVRQGTDVFVVPVGR